MMLFFAFMVLFIACTWAFDSLTIFADGASVAVARGAFRATASVAMVAPSDHVDTPVDTINLIMLGFVLMSVLINVVHKHHHTSTTTGTVTLAEATAMGLIDPDQPLPEVVHTYTR